jgi:hypothetical protein
MDPCISWCRDMSFSLLENHTRHSHPNISEVTLVIPKLKERQQVYFEIRIYLMSSIWQHASLSISLILPVWQRTLHIASWGLLNFLPSVYTTVMLLKHLALMQWKSRAFVKENKSSQTKTISRGTIVFKSFEIHAAFVNIVTYYPSTRI